MMFQEIMKAKEGGKVHLLVCPFEFPKSVLDLQRIILQSISAVKLQMPKICILLLFFGFGF